MAGDVQIMESTGKNTRRERNRRTPVQPPKKEHKISLMKVGISFLIVIALVLGSVSVVTVIKNREIHLSNFYDKSNAVFGIEKFSSMPTERLLFLKICVYRMEQKTILP